MKTKILVSGFEPFADHKTNSSQELITQLQAKYGNQPTYLQTVLLPVTYSKSFATLQEMIDRCNPSWVICTGLAADRKKISLERIAINCIDSATPDNDGLTKRNERIEENQPDGLFSTLPLGEIQTACKGLALETEISNSAGAYVCNYVMYRSLIYGQQKKFRTGFVHLPSTAKESPNCVLLNDITAGFQTILEQLT